MPHSAQNLLPTFDTQVVELKLPLRGEQHLAIQVNVFQGNITRPLERAPLPECDLQVLAEVGTESLADSLPGSDGDLAGVDILLGSDYVWNLLTMQTIPLPSGLILLSSKLGYILAGRPSSAVVSSSVSAVASTVH